MITLEQLTLNGAVTLLTYLQYAQSSASSIDAIALAAALCEMLNQLEAIQPGATKDCDWHKTPYLHRVENRLWIDSDRQDNCQVSELS